LFPILKIQKVFRGWAVRVRQWRERLSHEEHYSVMKQFFLGWREHAHSMAKVRRALKQADKGYLISRGREMRLKEIEHRMVEGEY
jgi:hypothetical protein